MSPDLSTFGNDNFGIGPIESFLCDNSSCVSDELCHPAKNQQPLRKKLLVVHMCLLPLHQTELTICDRGVLESTNVNKWKKKQSLAR
jgi:hypothetical protein